MTFFARLSYYNNNRTPHTSHKSDVSHGGTFFYRKEDHREQLKAHDDRLTAIEQRPVKWWDKLIGTIITAVGSAIGGSLLTLLVQSISK
nr:MAG TPA_asm: hypothetical protein [Caudoviricetes sp.]